MSDGENISRMLAAEHGRDVQCKSNRVFHILLCNRFIYIVQTVHDLFSASGMSVDVHLDKLEISKVFAGMPKYGHMYMLADFFHF